MERGGEKQVAFARSSRSFVTPAPSVWDFCCRRILICECGGRAEGLGLAFAFFFALRWRFLCCVAWAGRHTTSAPDLQRRWFNYGSEDLHPPPPHLLFWVPCAHARAPTTNTSLCTRVQVKGRISVEDTRCDFRWSPAGWMYRGAAAAAGAGGVACWRSLGSSKTWGSPRVSKEGERSATSIMRDI